MCRRHWFTYCGIVRTLRLTPSQEKWSDCSFLWSAMGHLHPGTHPNNLCVRWQCSTTGCQVLAQLLGLLLVTTNCVLCVPFEPRGSDRIFDLQAKFLLPIVLLFSLSGCFMAPLQYLLISLPKIQASVYSLPSCFQVLWVNLLLQCPVVINQSISLTLVFLFLIVLSNALFIHLYQPQGFCYKHSDLSKSIALTDAQAWFGGKYCSPQPA